MNRSRRLIVAVLALAISIPALAQKRPQLKVATLAPTGSSFHQILMTMGEEWRKAPSGGVTLTIFAGGSQGSEVDAVGRMRRGQLHGGLLTAGGMGEIDDSVEALQSMPMMFRSLDEVDYIREKLRGRIEKRLLDKGFVVLFWSDAGWVRFFTKHPVVRPDDLKKIDLYVTAGDARQTDIMKAAGYKPIPLSPNDILAGLQTGLISGVPTTPTIALAGQFYTRAPHMLEINWAPLVGGFVVTKKKWDALPPETQKALRASALRAGERMKQLTRAENEKAVAEMAKRKLTVHRATPQIENEWRAAAEKAYPKVRGGIVPADFFDEVQRLLGEYRKSGGAAQ
jgi:TRAP-type transport system periplasmic protein